MCPPEPQLGPTRTGIRPPTKETAMATRTGKARWEGKFPSGKGQVQLGSGAFEGPFSFASRFENGQGTNPEELIGAAEAGCYSMALSKLLTDEGYTPLSVQTTAKVHLNKQDGDFAITSVNLETVADVDGIDEATLRKAADKARRSCIVSRALAGTDITVNAKLRRGV